MTKLSALIVEDQENKIAKIRDVLENTQLYDNSEIQVAKSVLEARKFLLNKEYDLMILDVVLPNRVGEQPIKDGGVQILREVMTRENYYRPSYILGLTAYPESFDNYAEEFADYTWAIVQYDEETSNWGDPIRNLSRHIFERKETNASDDHQYLCDFCVVTALDSPEFDALMRLEWNWQDLNVFGDPTRYVKGEIEVGEHNIAVVAACASRMGMVTAAVLTANMIRHFKPRIFAMVGICAGLKDRINIGDVAIADPAWDYQSGKITSEGFEIAPHQLSLNSAIRRRLVAMGQDKQLLREIGDAWQGGKPPTELGLCAGPVASGSAVLANQDRVAELKNQHRQLIGIDMETYGVFAASSEACLPLPYAMAIKGVQDYGDERKGDEFREYAAYVSARVFDAFVRREYLNLIPFLGG